MLLIALFVTTGFSLPAQANEPNIEITSRLSHPYIEPNKEQTVFLKISLKGKVPASNKQRAPINLALVLDKSGSMQGQKIESVKQASKMLIDRLRPYDTISVIVYDNKAHVAVPATQLIDPTAVKAEIDRINASGSTALYDGVKLGANELKRFISDNKVNRVLLLSDGMANIGPSSPQELARLGLSLAQSGISISTIGLGLGYNEDLMSQLAAVSDGFHQFAQETQELTQAFNWQFGKLSSIVGNNTKVTLDLPTHVTPIRLLGRSGKISDRTVQVSLNQIFSSHEAYILLEAKVAPIDSNQITLSLADITVTYNDLDDNTWKNHQSKIVANLTTDQNLIGSTQDTDVIIAATEQIAGLEHAEIIELRDAGKVAEAEVKLEALSKKVSQASESLNSGKLSRYGEILKRQLDAIKKNLDWNKTRKEGTAGLQSVSFGTI